MADENIFRFRRANPINLNEAAVEARRVNNMPDEINNIINPRRSRGEALRTVGIELESVALYKDRVRDVLAGMPYNLGNNFKVHRDASSEMTVFNVPFNNGKTYIAVNASTKESKRLFSATIPTTVYGYELISVPMEIQLAEITLRHLLPALELAGDFISDRCATHIHVGGIMELEFLKRALGLGLWFDEVFFALSPMGQEKFRGHSNNAIYARPLVNGPFFKKGSSYYQILNWEQALKARDIYEFYCCYGINSDGGDIPKYHPGRYFSINLYSIPRIGTVEFRHFNQSFDANLVVATTKLCQLFVEVALKSRMRNIQELEPGNTFKFEGISHYISKLHKFLSMAKQLECNYSLELDDISAIEGQIVKYKGIGVDNCDVMTHCREFEVGSDVISTGKLRYVTNKPIPDGHIDIHNIEQHVISIMK